MLTTANVGLIDDSSAKAEVDLMKRFCMASAALMVATLASRCNEAQAVNVDVSLNVYPAAASNPNGGGAWSIVAKTDSPHGIAAINLFLTDISLEVPGFPTPSVQAEPDINALRVDGKVPVTINGSVVNVLYGQDTSAPGVVIGVGTPSMSDGPDPFGDPNWNSATRIFVGAYAGDAPSFASHDAQVTDANVLSTSAPPFTLSVDADTTTVVRVQASRPNTTALVDQGNFTYDPATGLRWMDLTAVVDRSYNDVSMEFGPGGDFEGLRYATGAEVLQLWQHAGITDINVGYTPDNYAAISPLVELLGNTSDNPFQRASGGFVAEFTDGFVRFPGIAAQDFSQRGVADWLGGQVPLNFHQPNIGHWLVQQVPEPAGGTMPLWFALAALLKVTHARR
jgi:hypothetical protein